MGVSRRGQGNVLRPLGQLYFYFLFSKKIAFGLSSVFAKAKRRKGIGSSLFWVDEVSPPNWNLHISPP